MIPFIRKILQKDHNLGHTKVGSPKHIANIRNYRHINIGWWRTKAKTTVRKDIYIRMLVVIPLH